MRPETSSGTGSAVLEKIGDTPGWRPNQLATSPISRRVPDFFCSIRKLKARVAAVPVPPIFSPELVLPARPIARPAAPPHHQSNARKSEAK
jgi:hypothetical protein